MSEAVTTNIDKKQARLAFSRAAETYDEVAVLQREIGSRMLQRLDLVRLQPQVVLDLGAGTGMDSEKLLARYPKARVYALDFALPMLQKARKRGGWLRRPFCLCGDLEHLPLADDSVDLIFSNFALQWAGDLSQAFRECYRVLRPNGLLMFSTLGPDTLKELRAAWAACDGGSHVSPFLDMHDVGDMLIHSRFADPVMDVERMQLTYHTVHDLMRDLKDLGAHNSNRDRSRGLTGKARMRAMQQAYEQFRCDGLLPASYEVVHGHAWIPSQKTKANGEVAIPLDNLGL